MYSFMQKKRAIHVEEAGAAQPAMVNLDVVSHSRPFTSKNRGKASFRKNPVKVCLGGGHISGGGGGGGGGAPFKQSVGVASLQG